MPGIETTAVMPHLSMKRKKRNPRKKSKEKPFWTCPTSGRSYLPSPAWSQVKHSFSYLYRLWQPWNPIRTIFFLCVKTSRAFSCINSLLPSTPRYWKSGIRVENKLFHAQGLESISHEEGVYGSQVGIHFTRPVHVQPILLQFLTRHSFTRRLGQ